MHQALPPRALLAGRGVTRVMLLRFRQGESYRAATSPLSASKTVSRLKNPLTEKR